MQRHVRHARAELGRLGVPVSIGLHHDRNGRALIAGEAYRDLWDRHYRGPSPASRIEEAYGRHLLEGRTPAWQCRAGSRHLYVDEHGRAQYCASQRGRLDRPIVAYTRADMRAQAKTRKGCESGCSIFCGYRASRLDNEPLAVARSVLRSILDGGIRLPGFRGRATGAAASRAAATD